MVGLSEREKTESLKYNIPCPHLTLSIVRTINVIPKSLEKSTPSPFKVQNLSYCVSLYGLLLVGHLHKKSGVRLYVLNDHFP